MSRHHDAWRNGEGKRQRARIAALLPQPCCRCGGVITREMDWEADHLIPLARIPAGSTVPPGTIRPAHKACNRSAGGKQGAAITNSRKKRATNEPKGIREW